MQQGRELGRMNLPTESYLSWYARRRVEMLARPNICSCRRSKNVRPMLTTFNMIHGGVEYIAHVACWTDARTANASLNNSSVGRPLPRSIRLHAFTLFLRPFVRIGQNVVFEPATE